jgi:hypothetical protein
MCISTARLWEMAWTFVMDDDLSLTREETDHLKGCHVCCEHLADCIRRLPEEDSLEAATLLDMDLSETNRDSIDQFSS